jgi:hypothetical protein
MAAETKITIRVDNLGKADDEFGVDGGDLKLVDGAKAIVNVLIDGAPAEPKVEKDAISVTASSLPQRNLTVVVTRKVDDKVIRILTYDSKTGHLIPVKPV